MNRGLVVVALAAAGIVTWIALSEPDAPDAPIVRADVGAPASARPLPALVIPDVAVDAALPKDAALNIETVKRKGVIGMPVALASQAIAQDPYWEKTSDEPPTFRSGKPPTTITLRVKGGRVIGARADFPKDALSAHVAGLSPQLVGNIEALPGSEEMERFDVNDPVDKTGIVETSDGRSYHWRVRFREKGEPPWGPVYFEIGRAPIPAPPSQ